ncbi:Ig-like domain-containing protein, partial [Pseudomonas guineae]|uniref:Ig-like domain-containing protein n=1 Tax=Pseudomonas guineae TaxID=425504 RepID=UPI0030EBE9BB
TPNPLGDGESGSLTATDSAGNESAPAAVGPVDAFAPDQPTLALASDTGASNSDGISGDGTLNVTGLEAGATWEYSLDGGSNWITASGNQFALPEGNYPAGSVQVRQTDSAGNTSATGATATDLSIDLTGPATPTIAGGNGYVLNGTAEPGALVVVSDENGLIGTTLADAAGVWMFYPETPIPAGSLITAVAEDTAGNPSNTSEPYVISLETVTIIESPSNLTLVTPPILGLLSSDIEGTATGASQVRIDVVQDSILPPVNSGTVAVTADNFSVSTNLLTGLLGDVGGVLIQEDDVLVGFTAIDAQGNESNTVLVNFGDAGTLLNDTTGALTNLLGGAFNSLLGAEEPLIVESTLYTGSAGNDQITGSATADMINGASGDDVIFGNGGADSLYGGEGNDALSVTDLGFTLVDGGNGTDTLYLDDAGINLDLTALQNNIENIEALDISGINGNDLLLDEGLVTAITDSNNTLRIEGDSSDSLTLNAATLAQSTLINGNSYDVYQLGSATLYVDQEIATSTA